jgi:hypothetical protein
MFGRLVRLAIELGEYEILYLWRLYIKGQDLADFIVKYSFKNDLQDNHVPIAEQSIPSKEVVIPSHSM